MQAAHAPTDPAPALRSSSERRGTDDRIAHAIRLGWCVAELYSLRAGELPSAPPDNILPLRTSLPPTARLRLELQAAAGDAQRAGVATDPDEMRDLLDLASRARGSEDAERELRIGIENWHIGLATALWADDAAAGEAYELGSFLSDTWNRVVMAMRRDGDNDPLVADELLAVFSDERVARIDVLLDNLQARIDPAAVRIVQHHLEAWRSHVHEHVAQDGPVRLPFAATRARLEPLASQTIMWRQIVTGEKEPEAFIGREARAKLRDTMVRRMIAGQRFRWRWLASGGALAAGVLGAGELAALLDGAQLAPIVALGGTLAAAFGVKLSSIALTLRRSLDARAELIWNTALAEVICEQTLRVGDLFAAPETARMRISRTSKAQLERYRARGGGPAGAGGAARPRRAAEGRTQVM